MSFSTSYTESTTFTVTHARHMAAKVAADLKRMQRFYKMPSDTQIANYEAEATELLKAGYLRSATYGFKRHEQWIEPTLIYTAKELSASPNDDDPGRIKQGADITGAAFGSYLTYTSAWFELSDAQRGAFQQNLPISRNNADEPSINGYLESDRTYSAGGRALERSTVRSFR